MKLDNAAKAFNLHSVHSGGSLCHQEQENHNDVILTGAFVTQVETDTGFDVHEMDGCSIVLGELTADVVREPHCTNDTWKSALHWIAEQGFEGEPAFVGHIQGEEDLEVWAVAKFKEDQ